MSSFRTIFFIAVTAFAAFASASPIDGANDVSQIASRANGIDLRAVDVPSVSADTFAALKVVEVEERAAEVVALPALINTCQQALATVQANVNVAISTGLVNVAIVTPFLSALNLALTTFFTGCRLLVGLDVAVIFGGTATVQTVASVSAGFAAIMTAVVNIVLAIFGAVGTGSLLTVLNIVIGTGGIASSVVTMFSVMGQLFASLSVTA